MMFVCSLTLGFIFTEWLLDGSLPEKSDLWSVVKHHFTRPVMIYLNGNGLIMLGLMISGAVVYSNLDIGGELSIWFKVNFFGLVGIILCNIIVDVVLIIILRNQVLQAKTLQTATLPSV